MPCPTCDHTMQLVAEKEAGSVFWCPRCGTLRRTGVLREDDVPWLVERCRLFINGRKSKPGLPGVDGLGVLDKNSYAEAVREWVHLGIAEAINLPDERTKSP